MLTEGELAQVRADQTAELPDTCTITRSGGQGGFNATTGGYAATAGTTLYQGRCRVMPPSEGERTLVFGEKAVDVTAFAVTLPYDVPLLKDDDTITVSLSTDPQLMGLSLAVRHVVVSSLMTARRVIAEVIE